MQYILQLGIVCSVFWVSQLIEMLLPVAFPASVISLLLMLLLLLVRVIRESQIQQLSDCLTGNMGFFFLPASVSIMNYVDAIFENAAAFFTICVVSMVLTFLATSATVTLTRRLMNRKKEEEV